MRSIILGVQYEMETDLSEETINIFIGQHLGMN